MKQTSIRNDVVLGASVPATVAAGQPVELLIQLINQSKEPVYFGEINGFGEFQLNILNSKEHPPELTPLGKSRIIKDHCTHAKFVIISIAPGEAHEWRLDLNLYFELKPEKYTLSMALDMNPQLTNFVVSVERFGFTVQ